MGLRFRRRLRIFPGLWLNVSKRSGSLSAGGRGVTVNLSPKGHQETISAPGLNKSSDGRVSKRLSDCQGPASAIPKSRSSSGPLGPPNLLTSCQRCSLFPSFFG